MSFYYPPNTTTKKGIIKPRSLCLTKRGLQHLHGCSMDCASARKEAEAVAVAVAEAEALGIISVDKAMHKNKNNIRHI